MSEYRSNKTCPKCGRCFERDEFGGRKDGRMQAYCRDCQRLVSKEKLARQQEAQRQAKLSRLVDLETSGKVCTKCGIKKPLGDFKKDKRKFSGRRSACIVCEAEWRQKLARERYLRLRDELLAKAATWRALNQRIITNQVREKRQSERNDLHDNYVKRLLIDRTQRLKAKDIPEQLIELKRDQLLLKRLTRQMQEAIQNHRTERK